MSALAHGEGHAPPPLSVAQEALWYTSRLAPRAIPYNETISFRKDGPLDVAALRRALEEIVRRHAAWRTTFEAVGGEPVQVVHAAAPIDLPVIDLGHLTQEQAERRAVVLAAEMSRVPYDLRRGPLLRLRLMRFPGEHHRLYVGLHHIVFDGVSIFRVVLAELVALYDAFAAGRPSPVPDPAARYVDYARWEQQWIEGPRAARRLEHWRERLGDAPLLDLPHDQPRPQAPRGRGGAVAVTVGAETVARLREIGAGAGASLFQVLAATWALLLGRYAGQDDVVFATAADLRQRPEFERIVGYCLTPVVLRVDLGGDPSFGELVLRARNELLDGLDHLVPFERVVRELAPVGPAGANPIYQAMLVLEPPAPVPDPAWSLHLMDSAVVEAVGATKVDLELQLDERPDGHLAGRLIFDRDLFAPGTAARLARHWTHLVVAAATAGPSERASRLPLMAPDEEHRLVVEHNATATEWTGGSTADNAARALAAELGVGPSDAVLVLPSAALAAPETAAWPSAAGARIVAAPPGAEADGAQLSRFVAAEGVSVLHAAPATWQALVDTGLRSGRSVRALCTGGALSRELADELLARFRVLWHGYGTPEAGTVATLGIVERSGTITIGRPVANVRVHVLDGHDRPVPEGVFGRLVIHARGAVVETGERARWRADGRLELELAD